MKENLKKARKDMGLKLQEVADRAGIGIRMYQFIESGDRCGTVETWEKLSNLFGIPIQELRKDSTKTKKDRIEEVSQANSIQSQS